MSDAQTAVTQVNGPNSRGWRGLLPQPDNDGRRWITFLGQFADALKDRDGLSLVEAVGTLVFEATLRVWPVHSNVAERPETVLGLAAFAAGAARDAARNSYENKLELLAQRQALDAIAVKVGAPATPSIADAVKKAAQ